MKRRITVLLFVLVGLLAATRVCYADLPGEGYAWPTFRELLQTFILMKGEDISTPRVADIYGRVVYCELYKTNYSNDYAWRKIRDKIISRAVSNKEYYRIRYQVAVTFKLGRYDFKKHEFPISAGQHFSNVNYISLYNKSGNYSTSFCERGSDPIFSSYYMMELDHPLTIDGLSVSDKKVAKLMARMQQANNFKRMVYARIRVVVTGAEKGLHLLPQDAYRQIILKGYIANVDFFLDPRLTEPVGHAIVEGAEN